MIYFKKYLKLPGPKDLGMSDSDNAMASEMFRNNSTEFTWEQYYDRLKKDYPVKYFLFSTAPTFIRYAWMDLTRKPKSIWRWFSYHFNPSHRYHWLDLRQPKTEFETRPYRYGWMDTDSRMVMALMNLLVEFVEKEMPHGYFIPSEEEAAKDDGVDCNFAGYKRQLDNHKEYMTIYNYWKIDRFKLNKIHDDLLSQWSEARHAAKGNSTPEVVRLWAELNEATKVKDDKLNEMLHRLIDIRHCLWT